MESKNRSGLLRASESIMAVMFKAPEPGKVKTRLTPPLTPVEATALYSAMIEDTFRSASKLRSIDIIAAFAGDLSRDQRENLITQEIPVTTQKGNGLGERLDNLFSELFNMGYRRAAVVGTDSPDLPGSLIEKAFSLLRENPGKCVLGPASDGGYYLIALDQESKRPFEAISWSTEQVLKETIERLGGDEILLEEWHDIDIAADLARLDANPDAPSSSAFMEANSIMERLGNL